MVVAEMIALLIPIVGALIALVYLVVQYIRERERIARQIEKEEERWNLQCDERREQIKEQKRGRTL